jgi:hypothetical protein
MHNIARKREGTLEKCISACAPDQNRVRVSLQQKLGTHIADNVWQEKELVRLKQKLNKKQRQRGFTRIERAFVTTTVHPDTTTANISTIRSGQSSREIADWCAETLSLTCLLEEMQHDREEHNDIAVST